MKQILFSFFLFTCIVFGQSSNFGKSLISWSYPGVLTTNNTFKIYYSTNQMSDVSKVWTLATNVSGTNTYVYVDYLKGFNVNYLVSVSNMWGETIFLKINYLQNSNLR